MIKYQLRCDDDHEFEGWFQSAAAFDEQSANGLVECSVCGSDGVGRALMAPNLSSTKTRKDAPELAISSGGAPAIAPSGTISPAKGLSLAAVEKMQKLMTEMREVQAKIKADCRDVGTDFAEEARKIHYGEAEPEGIYGQATNEEREALDEEGIEIVDIPWLASDN